jgi:ACR3 family arsenite transporter
MGVLLGNLMPDVFAALAALEVARANLVVAALIWFMIYPLMVRVDFASVRDVCQRPKGLAITRVVNGLIKSFTVAALGGFFFRVGGATNRKGIYRGYDFARRRALCRDGICLESPDQR